MGKKKSQNADSTKGAKDIFLALQEEIDKKILLQESFYIARFSLRNLKRYQMLFGEKEQIWLMEKINEQFAEHASYYHSLYRFSFFQFILIINPSPEIKISKKVRELYQKIKSQIPQPNDFNISLTYSIFQSTKDFNSGAQALSLL